MEIIIAEDELISRKLLQKILESFGHTVLSAENGIEAWELFQKSNTKMVITDWLMPEMDGLELCRKIREAETPHYVYIIIVTAKGQREDSVKGLDAGADDYIVKPYNPEELNAHIRSSQRIIQLEEASMHDIQKRKKMSTTGGTSGTKNTNTTGHLNTL